MNIQHLTKNSYSTSTWSGGTTTQLAIFPPEAVYAERNFLWRISSATVELEESDFTSLPDYSRWISTLSGSMQLQHNENAPYVIAPGHTACFDGADATHSWGKCTDFNLMLRKGKCTGEISLFQPAAEESSIPLAGAREKCFLYCLSDSLRLCSEACELLLCAGESVLISGPGTVRVAGPGTAMKAAITEL